MKHEGRLQQTAVVGGPVHTVREGLGQNIVIDKFPGRIENDATTVFLSGSFLNCVPHHRCILVVAGNDDQFSSSGSNDSVDQLGHHGEQCRYSQCG